GAAPWPSTLPNSLAATGSALGCNELPAPAAVLALSGFPSASARASCVPESWDGITVKLPSSSALGIVWLSVGGTLTAFITTTIFFAFICDYVCGVRTVGVATERTVGAFVQGADKRDVDTSTPGGSTLTSA